MHAVMPAAAAGGGGGDIQPSARLHLPHSTCRVISPQGVPYKHVLLGHSCPQPSCVPCCTLDCRPADANTWPTWGALRERLLTSCREVRVGGSPTVRDVFVKELVQLALPHLKVLDLHGSTNLRQVGGGAVMQRGRLWPVGE